MATEINLIPAATYDVATLVCVGWTDGDGSGHDGYHWLDYFSADGAYAGPDEHGIEPICERRREIKGDC